MTKLDDFSEAARLALAHMKPGVLTNHVMTTAEYRADVAEGSLYAYTWPGGLLFLRKRATYHMLSYCVNDLSIFPGYKLPEDTMTETAYKQSGAENAARIVDFWKHAGMWPAFERIRLTRASGLGLTVNAGTEKAYNLHFGLATPRDTDACNDLMYASFDRLTGHIPNYYELCESINAGHILCMKDSHGAVCGLLRWMPRTASLEIRQLALREDMRGKGLARKLINEFLDIMDGNKITVWARDGYAPALKSYAAAGFVPDGWRSTVLTIRIKS